VKVYGKEGCSLTECKPRRKLLFGDTLNGLNFNCNKSWSSKTKSKKEEIMNVFKKTVTLAAAVSLVCLSSAGAMAANKLIVKDSAGSIDKFVVTDTGRIGLNTSSPTAAVHLNATDVGAAQMKIQYSGTNSPDAGGFIFSRNNASGTNSMPMNGNRLGYFQFGGMEGATQRLSATIAGFAAADWAVGSTPAYIAFELTPVGSNSRAERMRIAANGNVGLSTQNPTQRLEINGGVRLNTTAGRPGCGVSTRGVIWYVQAATGSADTLSVCSKDASENYAWHNLF